MAGKLNRRIFVEFPSIRPDLRAKIRTARVLRVDKNVSGPTTEGGRQERMAHPGSVCAPTNGRRTGSRGGDKTAFQREAMLFASVHGTLPGQSQGKCTSVQKCAPAPEKVVRYVPPKR